MNAATKERRAPDIDQAIAAELRYARRHLYAAAKVAAQDDDLGFVGSIEMLIQGACFLEGTVTAGGVAPEMEEEQAA